MDNDSVYTASPCATASVPLHQSTEKSHTPQDLLGALPDKKQTSSQQSRSRPASYASAETEAGISIHPRTDDKINLCL